MKTHFLRQVRLGITALGLWRAVMALPMFLLQINGVAILNRRQRVALDLEGFDKRFGTDTQEMMNHGELGHMVSTTQRGTTLGRVVYQYQTVPEDTIETPLRVNLPRECQNFVFLDLGCGKGKPLLVASRFPFKRIIGVDISQNAIDIAHQNIRAFTKSVAANDDPIHRGTLGDSGRFDLIVANAESYVFPKDPLVLYMYNPFPKDTMIEVMRNLRQSLLETPRKVLIHYVNPSFRKVIEDTSLFELVPSIFPGCVYATRPAEWAWPKLPIPPTP